MLCKQAYFLKTFVIDELCYALPGAELTQFVLLLQPLFAAALLKLLAFVTR
jgi:hypothetical protein